MFFILFYLFIFLLWRRRSRSQVKMEEFFRCRLKIVMDVSDGGGKLIPPARNGEWKRSGLWFWASLWWHHEASLTRRSQTSGGDVDCYKWVEVGGCWACGCSKCKHQCLELDASCNREPVQGDKERLWHGPFWVRWRSIMLQHSESSVKVGLCMTEIQMEMTKHSKGPVTPRMKT